MIEGVDYSFARPGGAALVTAGKAFAVRYLTGAGKALTVAELADLRAHGIAVAVVFESTSGRALDGYGAGVADAQAAVAALAALGMPALPVYFAVDFDATAAQLATIGQYFAGVASVLGARTGAYGGLRVIQYLQASGHVFWFWQTYAWSGGAVAPGIHLYQYSNGWSINGGAVDLTRALTDQYGQSDISVAGSAGTPLNNNPAVPDLGRLIMSAVVMTKPGANVLAIYDESHWQEISYGPTVPPFLQTIADAMQSALPNIPYNDTGWQDRSNKLAGIKRPFFVIDTTAQTITPIVDTAPVLTAADIAAIAAAVVVPAAPASAPVDLSPVLAAIAALNTSDSNYLTQIEAILAKGFTITGTVK